MAPAPRNICRSAIEVFDRDRPRSRRCRGVCAVFPDCWHRSACAPATGDIGILMAAVRGLDTTPRRKAALLRHIWRPRRFRALLDRFAGRAPMPQARAQLLDRLASGTPEALIAAAGTFIGLRAPEDIAARAPRPDRGCQRRPDRRPRGGAALSICCRCKRPAAQALAHLRGITANAARDRRRRGPFCHTAGRAGRARHRRRDPAVRGQPRPHHAGILRWLRVSAFTRPTPTCRRWPRAGAMMR